MDYGALGLLDLIFMAMVVHYTPKFIASQTQLAVNLKALSVSINNNSQITKEQIMNTLTVLEELKDIKKKINDYDARTNNFKDQQEEMLEVLKEIKLKIERS